MSAPTRVLLPPDITHEELWWLYHNHPVLRAFLDRLIADAETAWRRHHQWETQL